MTPLAVGEEGELVLPYPLPHQEPVIASKARWKVLRCGRRWGKTRIGMIAALTGHGPGAPQEPVREGVLHGWDVFWVGPTRDQAGLIWREDLKPRLAAVRGMLINETERTATLPGCGTLHLISAEAIRKIRGSGARLIGVIIDEGAHMDLEYALRSVIRPALTDNKGWAIIMSTTNCGTDGNSEQRMPSYFNMICAQVQGGERSSEWEEFYGTIFDNPRIDVDEADDMVGEYEIGSLALDQEVFAKLLTPGAGLALPEMFRSKHVVPWFKPEEHWYQWGAFDWGYNHPFGFGWFGADEDGNAYLIDSVTGRGQTPAQIAETIRGSMPVDELRIIVGGHDCWNKQRAMGEDTPTVAERLAEQGIFLSKANIDPVQGLDNMRSYINWRGQEKIDGVQPERKEREPLFHIMETPTNVEAYDQLARMQIDPKKPEQILKKNAQNGKGGDDMADMVRYGLAARPLRGFKAEVRELEGAFSAEALAGDMELRKIGNRRWTPSPARPMERPIDPMFGECY